jgi:hypothetical protein
MMHEPVTKVKGETETVYAPTIAFKLPYYKKGGLNKNKTVKVEQKGPVEMEFSGLKCFDAKRNPIELTPDNCEQVLAQGNEVKIIFYANKVWKVNGKFSAPFTAKAIQIYPASKVDYEFINDGDEENTEETADAPTEPTADAPTGAVAAKAAPKEVEQEETDEETDDDEDDETA